MLIQKSGSNTALIILHEIYGVNRFITDLCDRYSGDGYDVYCSNINGSPPFGYDEREHAYRHFMQRGGFAQVEYIRRMLTRLRPHYARIILMGFSVGATLAWLCSERALCDRVICCYGSRIRDYTDITPEVPALLLFAEQDSFDVCATATAVAGDNTAVHIFAAGHGFLDPYGECYDAACARAAWEEIGSFVAGWENAFHTD